jgi:hypothetical protein
MGHARFSVRINQINQIKSNLTDRLNKPFEYLFRLPSTTLRDS